MASANKFGEFNPGKENWKSYIERLQMHFAANDIRDATKQRAILLSSCGPSTYRQIKDVLAPEAPSTVGFNDIVTKMTAHSQPPPSEIMQRYRFNTQVRQHHESVATYLAQLKQLAEYCNYNNEMLRDRLVCGIAHPQWQKRLLAEEGLTFDKAVKLLTAMESADQEVKGLGGQPSKPPQLINRVNRGKPLATGFKPGPARSPQAECYRCKSANHQATDCPMKDMICHYCHKKGHILPACKTRQRKQEYKRKSATHQVTDDSEQTQEEESSIEPEYTLHYIRPEGSPSIVVNVDINNAPLSMELDTGAALSLISEGTYHSLWSSDSTPALQRTEAKLKSYTGDTIGIRGVIDVNVQYKEESATLPLIVVAGSGPSLFGRNWLKHLRLDWSQLNHIQTNNHDDQVQSLIQRHPDLFKEGLGKVTVATAKVYIDENTQPQFKNFRRVPYAKLKKVEAEIDNLVKEGVLEPTQFSDWATPVVPVKKKNGTVRLCGDYRVTVNKVAKTDTYPIPRIEDVFATLSGGTLFTKLDMTQAYLQIPVDEESKKILTLNTHKGLFNFTRLPFGVASAPSTFQRIVEGILKGIPRVTVYIDDILVTGKTVKEHLENLEAVFVRLEEAGFRLKRPKCHFLLPSIEYLGYRIISQGIHPTTEKIRAVQSAPPPQDVTQLKAFLGLVNYYGRFLPDLSTVLAPLHLLLQKNTTWKWGREQEKAFQEVKRNLTSDCVLVHFDATKELILACDASPYGVGAVLSHRFEDGQERPIAFASRTLAPAEKNYSQIEKEGLAIIYGVKKFHMYLFGRSFEILSDHKPLQHMFSPNKATPAMASARLQRWSVLFGAYDYTLRYKPGSSHSNADSLSRLPVDPAPAQIPEPAEHVLFMEMLNSTPLTAAQIKQWSRRDPTIAAVIDMVLHGWQHSKKPELKLYQDRREELSVKDGCLLWGNRVVVPPTGREQALELFHDGHPGASRMKSLARSYIWWPGLDADIESKVKACHTCQQNRNSPPPSPLMSWEFPQQPWDRLHCDFAGPLEGKMFLIVVDAFSKWLEVVPMTAATSATTIEALRNIFATHGLPGVFVTDNGTRFTSAEFKTFMEKNGIRHLRSAPYHPATNGLAERAVQSFKRSMEKNTEGSISARVARFLFQYRRTPRTSTGVSPAELLFNRIPRSHLDLLKPDITRKVQDKQCSQQERHDIHAKARTFEIDDRVFTKEFPAGKRWIPGVISSAEGPQSYHITLPDGRIVRRHIDHIRTRSSDPTEPQLGNSDDFPAYSPPQQAEVAATAPPAPNPPAGRPTRNIPPPNRLQYGANFEPL